LFARLAFKVNDRAKVFMYTIVYFAHDFPMSHETVSTRLPQEMLKDIERLAERERVDRSEMIKRLLDPALQQRKVEDALEAYRDGKATLWRVAELAGVSLREMMELARVKQIPVPYTLDDLRRDVEHVKQKARREQH